MALNSGNYDLSYQGNNLTITKALLNVIADAKTKVYGDADPSLTYQVSGLKNGDTAGAVLNGGSLSRVAGENVGVYGINQVDEEKLTYAELDSRANRLAHALIARGVGPEVRVAIAMQRSAEIMVAFLAVLKAGGAYVPLDIEYPRERLLYMMQDSRAHLDEEKLTYAELDSRANRLAHALIARGVGPEVRVAIAMQRSAEIMVAFLAVLKAGGAYVPLDIEYPRERLLYMMQDSRAHPVEANSSRYVLRLVVMTRFVLRPERIGLTSTLTRRSAPLPLDVSPTIQRTVSPAATVTSSSPGWSEITVTRPTAA